MQPSALRTYGHKVSCLLRFSGRQSASEITQQDVDQFRLQSGLAASTVESAVQAAGALRGESFGGQRLRRIRSRNRTVPLDDLSRVYAVAQERGNVYVCRFLKWAYVTGFRLGDLLSLTREQMAADVIELDARKTGKYQAIPRHPILCCRLPNTEFPLKKSPGRLRRKLRYYCAAAGVPYFTPQAIRRTAATQYELARPGAGGVIQGSAVDKRVEVAWRHYIDQVAILTEAQTRLAIPESMRPRSERTRRRTEERQLLAAFQRIGASDRDAVLRMVSRFSW